MHILLVDLDAHDTAKHRRAIANAGHAVAVVHNQSEAIDVVAAYGFDACVVSGGNVDGDMLQLVRQLKASCPRTPLLVLIDGAPAGSVAQLIALGADDVAVDSAGGAAVLAHIVALVRRAHGHAESRIRIDGLEIDVAAATCSLGGHRVHLTPMEYRLVEALALRRGQPVPRTRLLELLYGVEAEPLAHSIDGFVFRIRSKFNRLTAFRYLLNRNKAFMLTGGQPKSVSAGLPA